MNLADQLVARIDWIDGHANVWRAFTDPALFRHLVAGLADPFRDTGITHVAGIEARGFILGAAVAADLGSGFVAIRKDGGLLPAPSTQAPPHRTTAATRPDCASSRTRCRRPTPFCSSMTGSKPAARRSPPSR